MVNTFVVYVFVVVHINHKKHMLVVKVVHVFFVVYINHKKHMKEANVVYVLHKKHVVGAFVVYVFLVVPRKPHGPPHVFFVVSHTPRFPPPHKPQKHINHICLDHANRDFYMNHFLYPHTFSLPPCGFCFTCVLKDPLKTHEPHTSHKPH